MLARPTADAAGQRKLQEAGLVQQLVTGLKQCATTPQLPDDLLCVQQALEGCLLEQSTTPLGAYAVSQSSLVLRMCTRRCARQSDGPTPAPASSLAMQGGRLLCDVQAGSPLQGAASGTAAHHAAGQQHCPHHGRSVTAIRVLELTLWASMSVTGHVCMAMVALASLSLCPAAASEACDRACMQSHGSTSTSQSGALLLQLRPVTGHVCMATVASAPLRLRALLLQGSMRWWLRGCHSSLWPG